MTNGRDQSVFDPATFRPTDTIMGYDFDRVSGYVRAYHSESKDALGIKPHVPLSLSTLDNGRVLFLHNKHDVCYRTGSFLIRTVAVFLLMPALRMRVYSQDEAALYHGLSKMDVMDCHRPAPHVTSDDLRTWHLYADPCGEDESTLLAPKSFVVAISPVQSFPSPDKKEIKP